MNHPSFITMACAPGYSEFTTNSFWDSEKSMNDYINRHLGIKDGKVGVFNEYVEVFQRDLHGNYMKVRTVGSAH